MTRFSQIAGFLVTAGCAAFVWASLVGLIHPGMMLP